MTVMFKNDPRVQQVSDTEYRLPDVGGHWTVWFDDGWPDCPAPPPRGSHWDVFDQAGHYCMGGSGKATADEAIGTIIGDPQ